MADEFRYLDATTPTKRFGDTVAVEDAGRGGDEETLTIYSDLTENLIGPAAR